MAHWLDDAAHGLAEGTHTRRQVLARGGAVAAGALLSSLPVPAVSFAATCLGGRYDHRKYHCCLTSDGDFVLARKDDECCQNAFGYCDSRTDAPHCCRGKGEGEDACMDTRREKCCHISTASPKPGFAGLAFSCPKDKTCCPDPNFLVSEVGRACCEPSEKCCGGVYPFAAGCYHPAKKHCCYSDNKKQLRALRK